MRLERIRAHYEHDLATDILGRTPANRSSWATMGSLNPDQVLRILELTDRLNLHREAKFIPLATEGEGSVTLLPDNRLRIVCPSNMPFDEWMKVIVSWKK
jgi:hypothetical protein